MWRVVSFIGLTFLFFPSQTSGAGEIGVACANSAIVQPMHYSKLYGLALRHAEVWPRTQKDLSMVARWLLGPKRGIPGLATSIVWGGRAAS